MTAVATEKGLDLLGSIDEPLARWLEEAYAPLSAREQGELVRLLEKLRGGRDPG